MRNNPRSPSSQRKEIPVIGFPTATQEPDVRRFRETYERIAAPAPRKPDDIYRIRHKNARSHHEAVTVCRETCGQLANDPDARRMSRFAAIAFLEESIQVLIADQQADDRATGEEGLTDVAIDDLDRAEDAAEKRADIRRTPETKLELYNCKLMTIAGERIACAILRPQVMPIYAPRSPHNPRSAA